MLPAYSPLTTGQQVAPVAKLLELDIMPCCTRDMRFWVDTVLETVRRDHTNAYGPGNQRGPFLTARAMGLAMAALHDGGVNEVPGNTAQGRLIKGTGIGNPGALDPVLVRAAACHQLLLLRFPSQADGLRSAWQAFAGLFPSAAAASVRDNSERQGRHHGTELHMLTLADPVHGSNTTFAPGGDYWHAPPPNELGQLPAGPVWGDNIPLLITSAITNFAKPPGRLGASSVVPSAHFDADFELVRQKGGSDAGTRTPQEELIGIFWGYDGPQELGTPPRLYMQVALTVLDELQSRSPNQLSADEELRLLASVALVMADAGVEAWRFKYSPDHMMWRPAVGIPAGLKGTASPGVPNWRPLGRPDTNGESLERTPNFPAYPSGHATFGAAAFQLLRLYMVHKGGGFGFDPITGLDNIRFCCTSDEFNGRNRDPRAPRGPRPRMALDYSSLWAAIIDNSISRVYLGVHWQFDGVSIKGTDPEGEFGVPSTPNNLGRRGGVWLGCQLANKVAVERLGVNPTVVTASKA